MTAGVLAHELDLPLLTIRLDGVLSKYLGETGSKLRVLFDAVESQRAVYLFDCRPGINRHADRGSGGARQYNRWLTEANRYRTYSSAVLSKTASLRTVGHRRAQIARGDPVERHDRHSREGHPFGSAERRLDCRSVPHHGGRHR